MLIKLININKSNIKKFDKSEKQLKFKLIF